MMSVLNEIAFMGWDLTQWAALAGILVGAYVAAWFSTRLVAALIETRGTDASTRLAQLVQGPVRVLAWLAFARESARQIIVPSEELEPAFAAGTLVWIALAWAGLRAVTLVFGWWVDYLERNDRHGAATLLVPFRTIAAVTVVLVALLSWLDALGFNVGAVLAGLGVGGLAIALAAQDTLKNFIGSLMILLDRPYQGGDRIDAMGHQGTVEEIGLRSTRIRLSTGHLTTIPNARMAVADIENITRRPSIRRRGQLHLALDTTPEKAASALAIVQDLLADHEGMNADKPPRVSFDEIERDSLRISFTYWYHPPDPKGFATFAQDLNFGILRRFAAESIALAAPSSRAEVTLDNHV